MTQFEFDPDKDLKDYKVWLADLTHFPKGVLPLTGYLWTDELTYGQQYACEKLQVPESKGWDERIIDGYSYLAVIECKPEEVPEREKRFRENLRPFIEDFDGIWKKAMKEWMAVVKEFQEFDLEKASDIELREHLEDFFSRIHYRWRELHFYFMYPVFTLVWTFGEVCQELLGIDQDHPTFKTLTSGFDNRLFKVNQDLWKFGDRAKELGLADIFMKNEDKDIIPKLEGSNAGKEWLREYREWLMVEGWRNIDMWDVSSITWMEDHNLPLRDIKQAIAKGGTFALDAERKRLTKERERAEKEVMAKVPTDKREWFEKLMRVAQKGSVFSEEHNWYLDQHVAAISRLLFLEYGRRFKKAGIIDDAEDIFYLLPPEIRKASICMDRINLRTYVKARKEERELYLKIEPKPFLGDMGKFPDVAKKNPLIRVIASPPKVKTELKADLYAAATAPGVVEGTARLILRERDLDQLQPGEILVTVATAVPWTPAFSIISGVVTNAGGGLSHAVLVAREYGIPACIGTREATKKIKTGDRIRVDGDQGAVYILKTTK
jgi:phosphohistidine swiveling domain-containing protein